MNFIEQFRDKDIILFTHNDLDGVASYLIYKTYIEQIANISFIEICDRSYIEDYDFSIYSSETILLFTDISPITKEQYDKLIQKFKVIIVDHHKSARDFLGENLNDYYYDENKCGAKIFFDLIRQEVRVKKVVAQFIELVNTFDLYQTESLLWKQAHDLSNVMFGYVNWALIDIQTGLETYGKFIEEQYNKFIDSKQFFLSVYEQSMARKAEAREKLYLNEARKYMKIRVDNLGNTYGFIELPSKVSWVAHLILKENNKVSYLVLRSTFKDTKINISRKLSIRSNEEKNINCAIIAEQHSGGGHKYAASCEIKDIGFFENFRKGKVHLI